MRTIKTTPEWVYELSRISNSEAVLYAIALDPPYQIEFDGRQPKQVTLRYQDDYLGFVEDTYAVFWAEMYLTENLYNGRKRMYILWQGYDATWYVTMCYTEL
jgi:hypothetical protein